MNLKALAHNNLGLLYLDLDRTQDALLNLQKSHTYNPKNIQTIEGLGGVARLHPPLLTTRRMLHTIR